MLHDIELMKNEFDELRERVDSFVNMADIPARTRAELNEKVKEFDIRLRYTNGLQHEKKELENQLKAREQELSEYKKKEQAFEDQEKRIDINLFTDGLNIKSNHVKAFLYAMDDSKEACYSIRDGAEYVNQFDFAKHLLSKIMNLSRALGVQQTFSDADESDKPSKAYYSRAGVAYTVDGLDKEALIDKYMSEHNCTLSEATVAVLDAK